MSLGIAVVLVWLLFHVLAQVLLASRLQTQRDLERSTMSQLADTLTSEQDDAWAIYNPPTDVLGAPNGDGHEIDFFARDGKQQPYFWSYTYDARTKTLVRYRFGSPGGVPVKDVTYRGITKFSSHTYPLTALQDPGTPVYSTLYKSATLHDGIVHFYPRMPWIAGGNTIAYVHVEGATSKQNLQLVTQTAPSGFIVVLSYTPSPSPQPSAFKTWPANLALGASGANIGTSGAGPCYAYGYTPSGAVDTSLPASVSQALGVYVNAGGCEVNSLGQALTQAVAVAYEPSGNTATFNIQSTSCPKNTAGAWATNNMGVRYAYLNVTGQSAGSCNVTLTDGLSLQAPLLDAGLVDVNVLSCAPVAAPNGFSYCIWYGQDASGCAIGSLCGASWYQGTSWYYNVPTAAAPTEDCSQDWQTGYCTWSQNGATAFCSQQTMSSSATPPSGGWPMAVISSSAGFTCAPRYTSSPPAQPFTYIPCQGTALQCHPPNPKPTGNPRAN